MRKSAIHAIRMAAVVSAVVVIAVSASISPSKSDDTTGLLSGVVTDSKTGRPLQFAKVELSWHGQAPLASAVTDRNGFYVFMALQPGMYTASAAFNQDGQDKNSIRYCGPIYNAIIEPDQSTSIDFPLYDVPRVLGHVTVCRSFYTVTASPQSTSSLYTYDTDGSF